MQAVTPGINQISQVFHIFQDKRIARFCEAESPHLVVTLKIYSFKTVMKYHLYLQCQEAFPAVFRQQAMVQAAVQTHFLFFT
jgi:hypothetical protein